MTEATGSDYVLAALEREGVGRLYGLVGEGNAHLVDRTRDAAVPYTYARHEQVAATMADAHARVTGEVGAVTLTHGPGVTNAATGIAAADRDRVPLVVLVGDTGIVGRETSLQYLDHLTFADPISRYGTRVETPAALPGTLARAFDAARTRRGPVVVELPTDVQEAPAPAEPYAPVERAPQRPRPDPDRLAEAARVLDDAAHPVVLVGGGAAAAGAADAVEALAARLGAPVVTTFFGKGLLPDGHPLVAGIGGTFLTPASEAALDEADAVLALGARLSGKSTRYGALYADVDVVQVDVDPAGIGVHEQPAVGLVADARAACESLLESVEPHPDRAERVRESIAAAGDPSDVAFVDPPDRIDPRELTVELAARVGGDALVTVGSGNLTGFPPVFHPVDGGRMLVNGNFGTMGWSLPAALGAQLAAPDRTVVCYTGDGATLQVVGAVETAVRLGLPVVVAVCNDAAYGIIRHRQRLEFDRETASAYDDVDFAAVARGFGARAATVRSPEDLDVVDAFLAERPAVPLVLDAKTDPEVTRPGFPPY